MKINISELFSKAKEITNSHHHNIARNKRSEWIQSAFNSIAFGNINIFLRLIALRTQDPDLQGLDVNLLFETKFKQTILHSLCRNQRILMIEYFLNNNIGDPNKYSVQAGMTPFHLAVIKSTMGDNTQMIECLLKHGADILKKTKKGETVQDLVKLIDPDITKQCSRTIIQLYQNALSTEMKIIIMQITDSPARDNPPFGDLTDHLIMELLYLI